MIETRRQKIVRLETELADATARADTLMSIMVMQGTLLSNAADIFEEVNMREVWEQHLDRTLGGSTRRIGAVAVWEGVAARNPDRHVTAHQQEAHLRQKALEPALGGAA
jgi:hypothetical protein